MKKKLLLAALFTSFISVAQIIESKIPNNADLVVSINGDRLTELISIPEFDNYNFSKKILKELTRKTNNGEAFSSIKDLGFDVNSKAFYFLKTTDSINYHTFLIKLTDRTKFESLIPENSKQKVLVENGLHILVDNSSIVMWDDTLLLFSGYKADYKYFEAHKDRFIKDKNVEEETEIAVEEVDENDEEETEIAVEEVDENDEEEIEIEIAVEDEDNNEFISYYLVKKEMASMWAKSFSEAIFKGDKNTSILKNRQYLSKKDKKAAASLWVSSYGQLLNNLVSNVYGKSNILSTNILKSNTNLYGFESITANLYFEEDGAKLSTEMEVISDWQKVFKKMYKSKIDKDFYKYFNQNNVLAYFGLSMNTQAILEEYPGLAANMYGGLIPKFKEELELGLDFMSLLIDEKAIAELVTGDMLFVLNDFGEKEVSYVSYDYDENYNKSTVTKTKKETVPDFTIMVGSKKGNLLNKMARLGIKYKLVENEAGYYKINAPKKQMPFDLYAVVKNDILFFTTSKEQISAITHNNFVKDLGKHKKLIKNNSSIFYVNGEKMLSKVPVSELNNKKAAYFKYAQDNLKEAYFKSSKMKGNTIYSEMKINTKGAKKNSLKTIFDFIEFAAN